MSLRLKKNDNVMIIAGDNKGQSGRIIRVIPDKSVAMVEGKNLVKRHTKPNRKNQQGGILEQEAPIHLSNLMYIDGKSNKPSRIGIKTLENGKRVRFSIKAKELVD